jgi:hypothetical protein
LEVFEYNQMNRQLQFKQADGQRFEFVSSDPDQVMQVEEEKKSSPRRLF